MQIFARITKVDEATGKVYGRAVQEMVDRSGEIFDYKTSKPNFAKWSSDMAKATEGKSVGNVRAMHGKVAAGKLTEITFNDAEKAIDVCAEIVDPVEREKCIKGVYSGFSIGGRYGKKWADEVNKGVQRYTAEPTEISIVDLPCVPSAQFTVVKADGSEELRKFETTTDDSEALAKWIAALPEDQRAVLAKALEPAEDKTGLIDAEKSARAERLAKHPHAAEIANVIHGCMGKAPIEKGLWTVSTFACLLDSLACVCDDAQWEAEIEGDNSPVPAALRAAFKQLAQAFIAMASEEVAEAVGGDNVDVIELSAKAETLQKAVDDGKAEIEKITAAHGEALAKVTADLEKITSDRDDLQKKLAVATETLAKTLTPAKGAVRVVEKTLHGADETPLVDDQPVLGKDGSIDHVATAAKLVKAAHSRPVLR